MRQRTANLYPEEYCACSKNYRRYRAFAIIFLNCTTYPDSLKKVRGNMHEIKRREVFCGINNLLTAAQVAVLFGGVALHGVRSAFFRKENNVDRPESVLSSTIPSTNPTSLNTSFHISAAVLETQSKRGDIREAASVSNKPSLSPPK